VHPADLREKMRAYLANGPQIGKLAVQGFLGSSSRPMAG